MNDYIITLGITSRFAAWERGLEFENTLNGSLGKVTEKLFICIYSVEGIEGGICVDVLISDGFASIDIVSDVFIDDGNTLIICFYAYLASWLKYRGGDPCSLI